MVCATTSSRWSSSCPNRRGAGSSGPRPPGASLHRVSEELDLQLDSGRLHAQRFGDPGAPLILAVHGLSANMHAFDRIAPQLVGGRERQLVALDLRGRGGSDLTPQGTY